MKRTEYNTRPCARCGTLVIDVRDAYTYATFPVNAESVAHEGLVLTANKDTRKNPFAQHAVVFVPHLPVCKVQEDEAEDLSGPSLEGADPGALPPGGMAGEEE